MKATTDRTRLLRRLRDLVRGARLQVDELASVRAVNQRSEEVEGLFADLERQLGRVRRSAVITLVGATGAGKSTLLNALVGGDVAISGEDRPTTRRPVVYAPQDADLQELLAGVPGEAPRVVRYDPAHAHGPWTEQVLVDAPDINSIASEHREVVAALADRSDALVAVLHRQSVAEDASATFLDDFAGRRHLIFVLNRVDELTEDSRAQLLEQVARLGRERWQIDEPIVIATSALAARTQPQTAGWAELCQRLAGLVQRGALGAVRRHNALGTARALAEVFGAIQAEVGADLQSLPAQVEEGVRALGVLTDEEVRARLEPKHPDIAEVYCSEVAKHWDGPGGWTLRSGGLGTLGMGAGAMLARRNPLLAAGAAVGGMAVGRAREAVRRRGLSDAAELLPPRGEFDGHYADVLGPARLTAARLTGDPEAFGVPAGEQARERTLNAVEEPWATLMLRSLPAKAQRAASFLLRWLVDLPVYALAGWVVYLAVRGFFGGEYVGLDFLVNTLLILAAYLFIARFLLRRAFGLAVKSLTRDVRTHVGEELGRMATEARDDAERQVGEVSRGLERLVRLEKTFRGELLRVDADAEFSAESESA